MVYNHVVIVATASICLDFRTWTWFHVGAVAFSIGLWFLFNLVYSVVHVTPIDNMYGNATMVFRFVLIMFSLVCFAKEAFVNFDFFLFEKL